MDFNRKGNIYIQYMANKILIENISNGNAEIYVNCYTIFKDMLL